MEETQEALDLNIEDLPVEAQEELKEGKGDEE